MSEIRISSITVKNYRSFNEEQSFEFPNEDYKKPVAIVGYNNSGKTNLMNCILYGLGQKFINQQTFELNDFHKRSWENIPFIKSNINADIVGQNSWGNDITMAGEHITNITVEDNQITEASVSPSFFGANKYYSIFYINFHKIKEEISTQKTSWGNLKSFLAKHIKKIVDSDESMKEKKGVFEEEIKGATEKVLQDSDLNKFIKKVKENYSTNLRDNNCEVDFGLPDYEDIFLQMMFKIGLNGDSENLIPINHFGDGFISMFVMAVIQAIAESDTGDKCLFLFEEPESFLHENHQEYFYKMVLCSLSERGHQVIYTTHSGKMLDISNTRGLIRLEFDEENQQTVKKYNDIGEFNTGGYTNEESGEIITLENYNSFIKNIEPSLNKILFSKKVVFVEGPNDLMAYKYAIEEKLKKLGHTEKYAEAHLNFENIAIIPHHGKITAILLIQLCKHIGLDYFVINDWDLDSNDFEKLTEFSTLEEMQKSDLYTGQPSPTEKGTLTTNWKLIHESEKEKIHFNVKNLETVLGEDFGKKSEKLWEILKAKIDFDEKFFPKKLEDFLKIESPKIENAEISKAQNKVEYDLPF